MTTARGTVSVNEIEALYVIFKRIDCAAVQDGVISRVFFTDR
jgi:hypothetical protein